MRHSMASEPHSHINPCRLWNQSSDDVDSLRVPQQTPVEALRDFLEPVITQMHPDEGIEDQFKVRTSLTTHIRLAQGPAQSFVLLNASDLCLTPVPT